MLGHDEHHREPAFGFAHQDAEGHEMEDRGDGVAMGRDGFPGHGKEFPKGHGLPRSVDAQVRPGQKDS